jgi:hypothetical protein
MMLARVLPSPIAKEVRALLPAWLGSVAVVGVLAAAGRGAPHELGVLFYGTACAGLGALSIGHEYTNRTLSTLLAQPASRARLLLLKLAVLAVMLVTLSAVGWRAELFPPRVALPIVGLSVLCALFVTPWLSMLFRSPVAGAVFTMPVPAWIWVIADALAGESVKLAAFEWGLAGFCALAAALGWWKFTRLEAIEGPGWEVRLPVARAGSAEGRRAHPIWLLAKKELALQFPSIVVAGIGMLGWLSVWLWSRSATTPALQRTFEDVLGALILLYGGLVAIVIGSLASAEERQLGTLEWQTLLPMASWRQWVIKTGTALGLAMLLTVALPLLSLSFSGGHVRIGGFYAAAMLLLTSIGLYVSSLSGNGFKAVLMAIPSSLLVLAMIIPTPSSLSRLHLTPLPIGLFALLLAVVLYFALLNHRSADRGLSWVARQVFCIGGVVLVGAEIFGVVSFFHGPWLR